MFSSIFIDRPRLAVVISLVITIAGLVAMQLIPVAQFPNIVPPQIQINAETMARFRPEMRKYYYDAKRYPTYLQQLGISWPPTQLTPPEAATPKAP